MQCSTLDNQLQRLLDSIITSLRWSLGPISFLVQNLDFRNRFNCTCDWFGAIKAIALVQRLFAQVRLKQETVQEKSLAASVILYTPLVLYNKVTEVVCHIHVHRNKNYFPVTVQYTTVKLFLIESVLMLSESETTTQHNPNLINQNID